ncbi:MAG TPA: sigma-70 family RNA polymerase sigma factor, partial [Candidatus Sulfopaludibacter sp.]|nr:sigma-70 family RNA polymerase sigma factor [Candidatus Sulfopaludibacter sp.]
VHFYTFAARLMRRILIDHARRWRAEKRGMRLDRVPLNDELAWVDRRAEESLDLSTALEELESLDAQKAKVVELRYFLGCTVPEIAALLNVSPSTIDRALRFSLAWLHDRLHGDLTDYGLRFRRTKYGSFIRSRASAIAGLIRSGADPSGGSAMPELAPAGLRGRLDAGSAGSPPAGIRR